MSKRCVTRCGDCFDNAMKRQNVRTSKRKELQIMNCKLRKRSTPRVFFVIRNSSFVIPFRLFYFSTFFGIAVAAAFGQAPAVWTPPSDTESTLDEMLGLPVDEQLATEINEMIGQLGSPSYKEREAAESRLIEIGPAAFARLRTTYRQSDELEVRLRIEAIVHESYLRHHVYDQNAFLGISQSPIPVVHDDDRRIQEGHVGIKVARIIEGTAAERVELKKGDVIIALDGEPIAATGMRVTVVFGESIRVRRPGVRMTLSVLRGPSELNIEVILGSRPRRYYLNQGLVSEMLDHFHQQFGVFWIKHFRRAPKQESGDDRP